MNMTKVFSPFGVDLFCFGKKFLVYNLISRNLKTKYHRSVLGILWTLLSPLSIAIIYYFSFKLVLKVQQPHYLGLLISCVLPWGFVAQTMNEGSDSILGNWGLLSKVPIPLQVFPFVGALTNLITLFLSIPVLLGVALFTDCPLNGSFLFIPLLYGLLFLMVYSLSYTLAVLSVFFRDLKHVTGIVLQIWFYTTPVIYHVKMLPSQFRWLLYANPVAPLFASLQGIVTEGAYPNPFHLLTSFLWALGLILMVAALSKYYFKQVVEKI